MVDACFVQRSTSSCTCSLSRDAVQNVYRVVYSSVPERHPPLLHAPSAPSRSPPLIVVLLLVHETITPDCNRLLGCIEALRCLAGVRLAFTCRRTVAVTQLRDDVGALQQHLLLLESLRAY